MKKKIRYLYHKGGGGLGGWLPHIILEEDGVKTIMWVQDNIDKVWDKFDATTQIMTPDKYLEEITEAEAFLIML